MNQLELPDRLPSITRVDTQGSAGENVRRSNPGYSSLLRTHGRACIFTRPEQLKRSRLK